MSIQDRRERIEKKMSDEEIRREFTAEGLTTIATHENGETRHYVVRDLSWELARYLTIRRASRGAPPRFLVPLRSEGADELEVMKS